MHKIEVQVENGLWQAVCGVDGKVLTFKTADEAHAKLEDLYPVLIQMEKYIGPKRTRVTAIWDDEEDKN